MGYLQREHMTHANNSTPPLCSHFLFNFFLKRNSQEKSAKESTKRANEFKYMQILLSYQLWNTEKQMDQSNSGIIIARNQNQFKLESKDQKVPPHTKTHMLVCIWFY